MSTTPTVSTTKFGRTALALWAFDPALTYLNHGTVGATPRAVMAEQQKLRDEIEREPARFQLRELADGQRGGPPGPARLRRAAAAVGEFIHARGEDVVFVENVTTGTNALFRSFPFQSGDEVLMTNLRYGAVGLAATHEAGLKGATVRCVDLPFPPSDPADAAAAFVNAIGPRTRLAVVEHITAESALVLPVKEIVAACRERGVAVIVDGAHAPGQIHLDMVEIGADWYTANLHKWAMAPRSCGFLWAPPERQKGLHPAVISWGYGKGFTQEFDLPGTRDQTSHLCAPAGIEFMRGLGLDAMRAYQRDLAWEAGQLLTRRWGTSVSTPRSMLAAMITVPLPKRFAGTPEACQALRDALLFEDRIEVQMHPWDGGLWARISAQVYVGLEDIERLADAVLRRA